MAISPALRNFTLQRGMDWSEQYIFKSTQTDGSEVAMDLAGYTVASEACLLYTSPSPRDRG